MGGPHIGPLGPFTQALAMRSRDGVIGKGPRGPRILVFQILYNLWARNLVLLYSLRKKLLRLSDQHQDQ